MFVIEHLPSDLGTILQYQNIFLLQTLMNDNV
jgi:hypothetical protein